MISGTQADLDWAGTDTPSPNGGYGEQGTAGAPPAAAGNGAAGAASLTDEQILGLEPIDAGERTNNSVILSEAKNLSRWTDGQAVESKRDSSRENRAQNDTIGDAAADPMAGAAMPEWMQSAAADPRHAAEAQQLWREHQEFRSAFASPDEARAIRELLPGGVKDVLSLRDATQSVERIDAAIFSGDARAQSEVVAELARTNPAAFRSLFAEAAKVLEAGGLRLEAGNPQARVSFSTGGENPQRDSSGTNRPQNDNAREASSPQPPASSLPRPASNLQNFDAAAYAAFERGTNDAVARDVRESIRETVSRVLPDGVAEGAARRIGDDIFHEIHRALAADRTLSEQVAAVLRDRRFGSAEQQNVASLLAGRARQLVPSVARRVIGEWTSSVLNTSRAKAARQTAAASRVDIAAAGGSLDSMPLRSAGAGSRAVDYASMSDEEILGL
jgi:hypothetical protein